VTALTARGVKVHTERVFGVEREAHLLRGKIILNVHYHDSKLWETVRMQVLWNFAFFLSLFFCCKSNNNCTDIKHEGENNKSTNQQTNRTHKYKKYIFLC
jgi:hypothetical protein